MCCKHREERVRAGSGTDRAVQGQPGVCLSSSHCLLGSFCWAEVYGTVSSDASEVAGCGWQWFQPVRSIPRHANYLQRAIGEQSKLLHAGQQLPCVRVPGIRERLTTTALSTEQGGFNVPGAGRGSGELELKTWL